MKDLKIKSSTLLTEEEKKQFQIILDSYLVKYLIEKGQYPEDIKFEEFMAWTLAQKNKEVVKYSSEEEVEATPKGPFKITISNIIEMLDVMDSVVATMSPEGLQFLKLRAREVRAKVRRES